MKRIGDGEVSANRDTSLVTFGKHQGCLLYPIRGKVFGSTITLHRLLELTGGQRDDFLKESSHAKSECRWIGFNHGYFFFCTKQYDALQSSNTCHLYVLLQNNVSIALYERFLISA